MWRELRFATHVLAFSLRTFATLTRSGEDELTFELGKATQHRQHQSVRGLHLARA
jgi:hypothetical protein